MPGARTILPDRGYRDRLGSVTVPWKEVWTDDLFVGGVSIDELLIDGSRLTGIINPERIQELLGATEIFGTDRSLAEISADATLGASDPVGRINAGVSLIQGSKIALGSIPFGAILGEVVEDEFLQSENYFPLEEGWILKGDGTAEFNNPDSQWFGSTHGPISTGFFRVDILGNATWGQFSAPTLFTKIDLNGRISAGGLTYDDAPFQVDGFGNFFLADSLLSLSYIAGGPVDDVPKEVIPSQSGGQLSGNLTLTPRTRGARVYYTTDGTDPTSSGTRVLYSGAFLVNPGSGATTTVKAVARKFGEYGAISTWAFTGDPSVAAAPTFSPVSGNYFPSNQTVNIALASGTAGATIKYTLDGSAPSAVNGTVYVTPIALVGNGAYQVRAIAIKAGLTNSPVTTANYTINTGGQDPGGGGTPPGDGGHDPV